MYEEQVITGEVIIMISDESRRKLRELGLEAFVEALDHQELHAKEYASMSFDRRLDLVIDDCYTRKNNDRARRLMRYAKLRYPNADIHSIYYDGRGLNKEQILLLSTGSFIEAPRNIVINGFTGTGKTYASAFAMRELRVKKLLFVVHREQIAVQAKRTFEMVFGKKIRFGLLTGNVKKYDTDFIFATKDTFTQENVYTKFDKCHFDAIIIDEVHRLGETTTYKRLLEYFKPKKLWLGMTASPERTDGYDIYNEFDHNIACEIRLQQALEDDLLCPFHYFGITEFNSTGEDSDNDRIEHELSDFRYLTSKKRIDYIISKMEFYGHSGDRVKGLVFCSRVEEAKELSKKFNERGYNTAVLVGDNNDEKIREDYIERLASDNISNKLDYRKL